MTTNKPVVPTPTTLWWDLVSFVKREQSHTRAAYPIDGLPFSRARALRRLDEHDYSQRELADELHVDAPAVSGIVTDLVSSGLADRRPDPSDGRVKVVSITEQGRTLVARLRADPEAAPPALRGLSESDRVALGRILRRLREAG